MTITTDLEMSKQLKEWGAPQDTEFYWYQSFKNAWYLGDSSDVMTYAISDNGSTSMAPIEPSIAAYTLEELILWLGEGLVLYHRNLTNEEVSFPGGDRGWYASLGTSGTGNWDTPLEAVFYLAAAIYQSKQSE